MNAPCEEDVICARSVGKHSAAPPSGTPPLLRNCRSVFEDEVEEIVPYHRDLGEELPWAHLENEDEKSRILLKVWGLCSWIPGTIVCRLTAETISLGVCHCFFLSSFTTLRETDRLCTAKMLLKLNCVWYTFLLV